MPDVIWKCPCGKFTHYPYNARVEREMHSLLLIHLHSVKMGTRSRKGKRYGGKKATSFVKRYYVDI
jgi:hypothetical protein